MALRVRIRSFVLDLTVGCPSSFFFVSCSSIEIEIEIAKARMKNRSDSQYPKKIHNLAKIQLPKIRPKSNL